VVLKVTPFWQDAITGVLLLLAITIDRLLALRVTRVLRARSRKMRRTRDAA
jgi:rhamnose transport system permease protein